MTKAAGSIFLAWALFLFPLSGIDCAHALSAREIMEKVENRDEGDDQTADMKMILIDRHGSERVRELKAFKKQDEDETDYQLLFFIYPVDVRNTGFLTIDYKDRDDRMWLYLPSLNRTRQISTRNRSDSFMGSDLNYADMTSRNLDDFTYAFYETKEMEVRGEKVWVITETPKSEDVVDSTGYKRSLLLVRQDNYYVVRSIRWEDCGNHIKYIDVTELDLIDGIWVGTSIHVNRKRGNETVHQTMLTFENVKFNQDLDFDLFTVRQLEQGP